MLNMSILAEIVTYDNNARSSAGGEPRSQSKADGMFMLVELVYLSDALPDPPLTLALAILRAKSQVGVVPFEKAL